MIVEQCAYGNRWRRVSPAAKVTFSFCGLAAALIANRPAVACTLAGLFAGITIIGAGVPARNYLRVAVAPLSFLCVSVVTLAMSVTWQNSSGLPNLSLEAMGVHQAALACARSLGGVAALLFLSLTTPLTDVLALLRRLRAPAVLLEMMTLCYRTLFVLLGALHDIHTAQAARLGYATPRHALRSLGTLAANLTVQVLQRSRALHVAALSRNNDGDTLRFLDQEYPRATPHLLAAVGAGLVLLALASVTAWSNR